jgi:hypothetical protein
VAIHPDGVDESVNGPISAEQSWLLPSPALFPAGSSKRMVLPEVTFAYGGERTTISFPIPSNRYFPNPRGPQTSKDMDIATRMAPQKSFGRHERGM